MIVPLARSRPPAPPQGGVNVVFENISPYGYEDYNGTVKQVGRLLETFHRVLAKNRDKMELAFSAANVRRIVASGRMAVFARHRGRMGSGRRRRYSASLADGLASPARESALRAPRRDAADEHARIVCQIGHPDAVAENRSATKWRRRIDRHDGDVGGTRASQLVLPKRYLVLLRR